MGGKNGMRNVCGEGLRWVCEVWYVGSMVCGACLPKKICNSFFPRTQVFIHHVHYDIPGEKPHYIFHYITCLGESWVNHDFIELYWCHQEHSGIVFAALCIISLYNLRDFTSHTSTTQQIMILLCFLFFLCMSVILYFSQCNNIALAPIAHFWKARCGVCRIREYVIWGPCYVGSVTHMMSGYVGRVLCRVDVIGLCRLSGWCRVSCGVSDSDM